MPYYTRDCTVCSDKIDLIYFVFEHFMLRSNYHDQLHDQNRGVNRGLIAALVSDHITSQVRISTWDKAYRYQSGDLLL